MPWRRWTADNLNALVPSGLSGRERRRARALLAVALAVGLVSWGWMVAGLFASSWLQPLSVLFGPLFFASAAVVLRFTRSTDAALGAMLLVFTAATTVSVASTGGPTSPFRHSYALVVWMAVAVGSLRMAGAVTVTMFAAGVMWDSVDSWLPGWATWIPQFQDPLVDTASNTSFIATAIAIAVTSRLGHDAALSEAQEHRHRAERGARDLVAAMQRLEDTLAESTSLRGRAEQASATKSELLATLSHELRTPLHGITGLAELLSGHPSLDPELALRVDALGRSARASGRLVGDVVSGESLRTGEAKARPTVVDPLVLLEDVRDTFAAELLARGQMLRTSHESLPYAILGDRGLLRRLLGSAAAVSVSLGDECHLGLRAETLEGAEIALDATVWPWPADVNPAELLPAVQGLMGIEASVTRGRANFRLVTLRASQEATHHWCPVDDGPLVVWVADDNPVNRMVLEGLLTRLNCTVRLFEDGDDLVEAFKKDPAGVGAIFTDLEMPRMDGLVAMAEIRKLPGGRSIPLVVVSAHALPEYQRASRRLGVVEFLAKPLARDTLVSALAQVRAHAEGDMLTTLTAGTSDTAQTTFEETAASVG